MKFNSYGNYNDELNFFIKNYNSSYYPDLPIIMWRRLYTGIAISTMKSFMTLLSLPKDFSSPYVSKNRKRKLREIIDYNNIKWI